MISPGARARACHVLGHHPPAELGLTACPLAEDDLVASLVDAIGEPVRLPRGWFDHPDDSIVNRLIADLAEARRTHHPRSHRP